MVDKFQDSKGRGGLIAGFVVERLGGVLKLGVVVEKNEGDFAGGAVAHLGEGGFGQPGELFATLLCRQPRLPKCT